MDSPASADLNVLGSPIERRMLVFAYLKQLLAKLREMVDQFTSNVNHQSISDLKRRGLFISVHDYPSIH